LYGCYGKKVFEKQFIENHGDRISITLPDMARGINYLRVVSVEFVGARKIFLSREN